MDIDIAAMFRDAMTRDLQSSRQSPNGSMRDYVYASGRHECVRAMALDLMHPEDRTFNDDSLARMDNGKDREKSIIARLDGATRWIRDVDVELIGHQQHHEYRVDGRKIRSGRSEFSIQIGGHHGPKYPCEIKSGEMARRARCLEVLDRNPWTSRWIDQILSYLIDSEAPHGFLILDQPGLPLLLPISLEEHRERAEAFRRDAETAVRARFDEIPMPDFCGVASVCRRCDHFGKSCHPTEISYADGDSRYITDPEVIEAAAYVVEHRETALEHGRAKKKVQDAMRGASIGVIGDVAVTAKYGRLTRYDIPQDIKNQYKTVDESGTMRLSYETLS